jgi:hypothetical protein
MTGDSPLSLQANMNVIEARKLVGDLSKIAPDDHPIRAWSVSTIKQGREGWNALRVWPLFERVAEYCGQKHASAAADDLGRREASQAFKILSAADAWDTLPATSLTPIRPPDESGEEGDLDSLMAENAFARPHLSMKERLATLMSEAVDDETENKKALAALSKEVGALALQLEEAAKAPSSGPAGGSLKAAVADALRDLAPSDEELGEAAKGARELPKVATIDPTFVSPKWGDTVSRWMAGGVNGVIGGSSGAGKTFPLKQICAREGLPFKVISMNSSLDAETLIASQSMKGGTSHYDDGPLLHAMRHGYVLIVDEGDALEHGEALVFNDAIESGLITSPFTGEVVEAATGFCTWFTSNSLGDELGLYNRQGFDESLKQRLVKVVAQPLPYEAEMEILMKIKSPYGLGLTEEEAGDLAKWAKVARPLHFGLNGRDPVLQSCPSTRILCSTAELWLGFNSRNGQSFQPLKEDGGNIRHALQWTFAADCSADEVSALKGAGLWVW